ncbi:DNA-3-methyladenine glycosylase I [bacterium]|nr:MAG: DNA-3-methyladenine glycosylase I [bacterium]
MTAKTRCPWAGDDVLMVAYHDCEWGVPLHDERGLFEFLVLEGAQAGLSWSTVLKKREAYRRCFDGFDPEQVARYGARRVEQLLREPGIVRNRLKIESAVANARAYLQLREGEGGAAAFLWRFAPPLLQEPWRGRGDVPVTTLESDALSKALKQRGFRFAGSTICYAFMQAVGMVNDHVAGCFRFGEINRRG